LGIILINPTSADDVLSIIKNEDVFYLNKNQVIYRAILKLYKEGINIDLLTVSGQLRKTGQLEAVGGAYALAELSGKTPPQAANNADRYSYMIMEKYFKRKIIEASQGSLIKAYDDSVDALSLLSDEHEKINRLNDMIIINTAEGLKETIMKNMEAIELAKKGVGNLTGMDTGLEDLNKVTGGWVKGDLTIIAARPGMGKTVFALTVARRALDNFIPGTERKPVIAFFSLEMSNRQLVMRLMSAESEIDHEELKRGQIDEMGIAQLTQRLGELYEYEDNLFIYDEPGISPMKIKAMANKIKRKTGFLDGIIVDYLQLMSAFDGESTKIGNREQEISSISRALKGIAKKMDIPVIALSQLSRAVESRGDKKPQLSDLRESGSIEQDADVVMFVYRPEYYKIFEFENGDSTAGVAEVIFGKNRHGKLPTIFFKFIGKFMKFVQGDFNNDNVGFSSPVKKEKNRQLHEAYMSKSPIKDFEDESPF